MTNVQGTSKRIGVAARRNSGGGQAAVLGIAAVAIVAASLAGCTQESQNQIGRSLQNWTGTNGVLDILAGDKVYTRFIHIDKLSTATATSGEKGAARPYRFGYGIHDRNLNFQADPGEKKVYFEFSDYSTSYVFYENDSE